MLLMVLYDFLLFLDEGLADPRFDLEKIPEALKLEVLGIDLGFKGRKKVVDVMLQATDLLLRTLGYLFLGSDRIPHQLFGLDLLVLRGF